MLDRCHRCRNVETAGDPLTFDKVTRTVSAAKRGEQCVALSNLRGALGALFARLSRNRNRIHPRAFSLSSMEPEAPVDEPVPAKVCRESRASQRPESGQQKPIRDYEKALDSSFRCRQPIQTSVTISARRQRKTEA